MEISPFSTDLLSSYAALNFTHHNLISIKILFHLTTLGELCNVFMCLFFWPISHIVKYNVKKSNCQIWKFELESRDLSDQLSGLTAQVHCCQRLQVFCQPNSVMAGICGAASWTFWLKKSTDQKTSLCIRELLNLGCFQKHHRFVLY